MIFDAVASVAAERWRFDYGALWPVSFAAYALVAFAAARERGSRMIGVAAGSAVAGADATVGWLVSWIIGPGAPEPGDREVVFVVVSAAGVVATGALLGLVGGIIRKRAKRASR